MCQRQQDVGQIINTYKHIYSVKYYKHFTKKLIIIFSHKKIYLQNKWSVYVGIFLKLF